VLIWQIGFVSEQHQEKSRIIIPRPANSILLDFAGVNRPWSNAQGALIGHSLEQKATHILPPFRAATAELWQPRGGLQHRRNYMSIYLSLASCKKQLPKARIRLDAIPFVLKSVSIHAKPLLPNA
jgi:hypothetical protein